MNDNKKIKPSELYNLKRKPLIPQNDALMMLVVRKMMCELNEFKVPNKCMLDWEVQVSEAQYLFMCEVFEKVVFTVFAPGELIALASADNILAACWKLWNEGHYPIEELMILVAKRLAKEMN